MGKVLYQPIPVFVFLHLFWENTSLHVVGDSEDTGQEHPYLWTSEDVWMEKYYLTFSNPAIKKSPAEILGISKKTTCFGSILQLYYLGFMMLIQTTENFQPKLCV